MIDRDTASRLGISASGIDAVLYDAFGQREVSTMYTDMNQYFVVMEVDPKYQLSPDSLNGIFIKSSTGTMVPLSTIAHYSQQRIALQVTTRGSSGGYAFVQPGAERGAWRCRDGSGKPAEADGYAERHPCHLPGTLQAFQDSLKNEIWLLIAAVVAVYIVLGILYESLIHPLTILSTIPSAGVGAFLSLMLTGTDLSVIALIGVLLLIGIVKKNAIMMIDFALRPSGTRAYAARGNLSGVSAALPADHDDDHGGDVRRVAALDRHGRGVGTAQAAGHHHRGRAADFAGADSVYDACGLPVLRLGAVALYEAAPHWRGAGRGAGRLKSSS